MIEKLILFSGTLLLGGAILTTFCQFICLFKMGVLFMHVTFRKLFQLFYNNMRLHTFQMEITLYAIIMMKLRWSVKRG